MEYRLVSEEDRQKPNLPWKYCASNESETAELFADEMPESEKYTFANEALSHLMSFAEIYFDESNKEANVYYLLNYDEEIIATIVIDRERETMTATFSHRSNVFKKSADKR